MVRRFRLFLGESGSPELWAAPGHSHHALRGWLVDEELLPQVESSIQGFMMDYPRSQRPLRAGDIRAKKRAFRWLALRPEAEQQAFHARLLQMVQEAPGWFTACVVDPKAFTHPKMHSHSLALRRSAFHLLLEGGVKLALAMGGELRVVAPKRGAQENALLRLWYRDLKAHGKPFDAERSARYESLGPHAFASLKALDLMDEAKARQRFGGGLELAALCVHPVARALSGLPGHEAYAKLKAARKLSDAWATSLGDPSLGIRLHSPSKQEGAAEAAPLTGHQEGRPLG